MKRFKMIHGNTLTMLLMLAVTISVTSCKSTADVPKAEKSSSKTITEGVAGGIFVNTVTVNAVVTAIDKKERTATLLGPENKSFSVKVGPDAVNFDQIAKGDKVIITFAEELVIAVAEKGTAVKSGTADMVMLAPKGGKPGGIAARTKQVTGTVILIDPKKQSATLKFDDGSTKKVAVRKDVDLSKYKKGDKVIFRVTEMIAIDIIKK